MLINPHYGPRLRLDTVTTDLPLAPDAPADIGAQEFCERCLRCARHCPQQAITHDDMTDIAPTKSNRSGIKRWIINAERCYIGRDINPYKSCGVCIRVCPWNKPNVWYHRLSVAALQRWRWARPALITLLLWLEDVFGYGKKQNWRNPLAEQRR